MPELFIFKFRQDKFSRLHSSSVGLFIFTPWLDAQVVTFYCFILFYEKILAAAVVIRIEQTLALISIGSGVAAAGLVRPVEVISRKPKTKKAASLVISSTSVTAR